MKRSPFLRRRVGLWRSPGRLIGAAAVMAFLFFALMSAAVVTVWSRRPTGTATWDLWQMFEGLASAATLAITVGGGLVVLHQLTDAIHSRNLAEFSGAFHILMSDQDIVARRWVYQLPDDPDKARALINASDEGRAHVKRVLNALDYVGFLVQQDCIAADAVIGWVSPVVVKTWSKLGPMVEDEAERRGEPDFYVAARELAERCRVWRAENIGCTDSRWVDDPI